MKILKKFFILFFALLFVCGLNNNISAKTAVNNINNKIIIYYFHGSKRCSNCLKIEEFTKNLLTTDFKKELKNGQIELKVLNIEEPQNKYFIKKYKLYTKSLIISNVRDNKETKWKNLEKIWLYLSDEEKFQKYVSDEIKLSLVDFKKNK